MARNDPQTRENYLTRLARAVQRMPRQLSDDLFHPKLIAVAQEEFKNPDTTNEFLPEGFQLAHNLIKAYPFPHSVSSAAIDAIRDRLDVAQRLGRIVGAPGLLAALDAIAISSKSDDKKNLEAHAYRIAFDPSEIAVMPQGVRLRCIGTFAITIDDPAQRAAAYATTLELLNDPAIDAFDKFNAARGIYDYVTDDWRADWFTWTNNPENKEKRDQLGALMPGILDAMLQTDAPNAARMMSSLSFGPYSGERGQKQPMAYFLDPLLKQVAEILKVSFEDLDWSIRSKPIDYSSLPKTLTLPKVGNPVAVLAS